MLGVGQRGVVFSISRAAVPGCWGQLDLAFFGPFITGKTFICISPAFPVWPQVKFCSGVEGRKKLLCCSWYLRQTHHSGSLRSSSRNSSCECSELLASVMVSWPLCPQPSASLFLKLSDLGSYVLFGVVTDTGLSIISSPYDPKNFLVTCLGFESWFGDWEFHLMAILLGFLQWMIRGPAWVTPWEPRVPGVLGAGVALLEGCQWVHSVMLTLLNTSWVQDTMPGSVEERGVNNDTCS